MGKDLDKEIRELKKHNTTLCILLCLIYILVIVQVFMTGMHFQQYLTEKAQINVEEEGELHD